MPTRILHIVDSLGRNGVAAQVLVLSRGLLAQGHDVHVVALAGRGRMMYEFQAARIATTELDRRLSHDPVALAKLYRLVRRTRPAIVHSWSADAATYARLAAGTTTSARLVAGYYRIDPHQPIWPWRRKCRGTAHAALATSSVHIRRWCAQRGLCADRFRIVSPGVPPARASDISRDELLRQLSLPKGARLIGVVGRLVPEKRVKNLIWAADLLRVLHDDLRLLVIGDGPLRAQLVQYARMASDLDHIQFLGERDDVWRIMPHLDVLWNADEGRSHSIATLEAMAAGVPVLASDTPFNRELVVEDETGYLIPLFDRAGRATRARHTDRIFTDGALAARLAAASRQRVSEHFAAERMLSQYVKMYAPPTDV